MTVALRDTGAGLHPWHLAIKCYRKVYFATMTRSGTWYSHFFFEFLEHLLTGKADIKSTHSIDVYDGIQCLKAHAHSIYPGFPETYRGPLRAEWDRLAFKTNGWNNGYAHAERCPEMFMPRLNPELSLVYLHRNPLDNCVSAFHHYKDHVLDSHRLVVDAETGARRPARSPGDFMRSGGLEGYLKQYFTFHVHRGEPNLLMVPYEDLVAAPVETFCRILGFIGFAVDTPDRLRAVETAAAMAAPENLRAIEMTQGRPLAGDQRDAGGSTMHGGAVGKWRRELGGDDVEYCRRRLGEFGISLDDFRLEHFPTKTNQFDGCKSVHPGRRGAKRDAAHRASVATPPGDRFAPP